MSSGLRNPSLTRGLCKPSTKNQVTMSRTAVTYNEVFQFLSEEKGKYAEN